VPRISIPVSQNATLFCCGEQHSVVIRGLLTARWQRNLFDEIEIEGCSFEPMPATQTVICRGCNHAYQIETADVRYSKGPLPADHLRHNACYRLAARGAAQSAWEIIVQAIPARSGGG